MRLMSRLSWPSVADPTEDSARAIVCAHPGRRGRSLWPTMFVRPSAGSSHWATTSVLSLCWNVPPTAEVHFVPEWGRGSRTRLQGAQGLGGRPAFRSQGAFWRGRGLSASQLGSWRILDPPGLQGQPCQPLASCSAAEACFFICKSGT